MIKSLLIAFSILLLALVGRGQSTRPTLSNGVISYVAEDGRREIRVGKECADLWASPDGSVIAFIAVEKGARPKAGYEHERPFIEQSSIYIARRSDQFKPIRIHLKSVLVGGRSWSVLRAPSVSPDSKTLYFLVPYTVEDWKLMSAPLETGRSSPIGDATDYCVVWGGGNSGDLLVLVRHYAGPQATGPAWSYQCELRRAAGATTAVAGENECSAFDEFAPRWSRERGGTCQPPGRGTEPSSDGRPALPDRRSLNGYAHDEGRAAARSHPYTHDRDVDRRRKPE
jgi:hypothetical protein